MFAVVPIGQSSNVLLADGFDWTPIRSVARLPYWTVSWLSPARRSLQLGAGAPACRQISLYRHQGNSARSARSNSESCFLQRRNPRRLQRWRRAAPRLSRSLRHKLLHPTRHDALFPRNPTSHPTPAPRADTAAVVRRNHAPQAAVLPSFAAPPSLPVTLRVPLPVLPCPPRQTRMNNLQHTSWLPNKNTAIELLLPQQQQQHTRHLMIVVLHWRFPLARVLRHHERRLPSCVSFALPVPVLPAATFALLRRGRQHVGARRDPPLHKAEFVIRRGLRRGGGEDGGN